ncbi:MAG: hypothetical protein J7L86_05090 [Candidatus Marinimicrobia bacterium]|nr:hypothetical protein [Candidatus Neomarinimicrobiota bacterium]
MNIKYLKNLLLLITIFLFIYTCTANKEIEEYQSILKIEPPVEQARRLIKFIYDHPQSDSTPKAVSRVLNILDTESGNPDAAMQFTTDLLPVQISPPARDLLYRYIFSKIAKDSASVNQMVSNTRGLTTTSVALAILPYMNRCFQTDSLRNRQILKLGKIIVESDYQNPEKLMALSDTIIGYSDTTFLNLSNQFLVKALRANMPDLNQDYTHPPDSSSRVDSVCNNLNFRIYLKLARNAYHQKKFQYALNLISQCAKYGDLQQENTLILLGAIQAHTGELTEGWGHVLKGLVLNPGAEKEDPEIENIYITLFRKIRGSREDPARFIEQYRRSHQ